MPLNLSREEQKKIDRIINKLRRLDKQSLISYWITAELDEAETYNNLAWRTREYSWDPRIPELFEELAEESTKHAEILLNEYKRTYPKEKLIETDIPSIELELSLEDLEEYIRSGRLEDLVSVLMESEKIAEEIYRYLAEESSGDTKRLFEHLADVERGHYQKLKTLMESIKKEDG
ncbi:hypothetical protein A3L11_06700 [Thermococcus siculi]|uniref:Ferritin-like diiron domain-containing protein n=1 Tax=Thermococcus siculi TaxID=72803 RepID=A0A2Z2MM97_9EURY|nr:ferritin family protein [Thermococcus siculi]ASJ08928.1 hypothetical protein A3L11_06700 [Thermococcus siculi]